MEEQLRQSFSHLAAVTIFGFYCRLMLLVLFSGLAVGNDGENGGGVEAGTCYIVSIAVCVLAFTEMSVDNMTIFILSCELRIAYGIYTLCSAGAMWLGKNINFNNENRIHSANALRISHSTPEEKFLPLHHRQKKAIKIDCLSKFIEKKSSILQFWHRIQLKA